MKENMIYYTNQYQLRDSLLKRMNEIIEGQKNSKNSVLLFGDSLIENLKYMALSFNDLVDNCGIAGITVDMLLHFVDEGVIKYNPKKVFILAGTNDLGETVMRSPREIAIMLKELVELIQRNLPMCKVYCLSLIPCIEEKQSYKSLNQTIRSNEIIGIVNKQISFFLREQFVDVYDSFLKDNEVDESLYEDGLHLNQKGYETLIQKLLKYV